MSERILIVEDEANIASFVSMYLQKAGYSVDRAATGGEGLEKAKSSSPSLIVLDLNLPDMDGLEVCRTLRANSTTTPILMLTARDDDVDKIVGLEVGADDYMTKPFNPRELVARIAPILRRATAPPPSAKGRKEHGNAPRSTRTAARSPSASSTCSSRRRSSSCSGSFSIIAGWSSTREQLLQRVWGYTFVGDTRTVDVHVRQLRRKLGDDCPVVTVWGVGYKVADDAAPVA